MFRSLLIANRGEIAVRVIRTARRLGLRTIAVYSEADAGAAHVEAADEAWPIGPPPARESYLSIDRIIAAARQSGAEAIHPGYGFLSENAGFAEACAAAGIVFVGPPPEAIRLMGSKSGAKALMERSGVPLVPGYHGEDQDAETLAAAAERIGYPVLIKASAGGGGKGMRVVESASAFAPALASAKREAASSFGDDRVLVEKYLTRPRHIEIQVFADRHGNVVSLFERDCSIQRRHQKIVEEAPAPGLDPERRRQMGEAACAAARAVGYVGAGTVEFIAEAGRFYFMEMNTRLQVEHPVTEAITGQDLVEWQLRVASGERLPREQHELGISGHAIEVRVYAEDAARDFAPSTGTLIHLAEPAQDAHVRLDTGIRQGDRITVHYDPMIAKLIAWGHDRDEAIRRLGRALESYEIVGVTTNLPFLAAVIGSEPYRRAEVDTGFIGRHGDLLPAAALAPDSLDLAAATLRAVADDRAAARADAGRSADPWSPWHETTAWRMNGDGYQDFLFRAGDEKVTVRAHLGPGGGFRADLPDGAAELDGDIDSGIVIVDGVRHRLRAIRHDAEITVVGSGRQCRLGVVDPLAPSLAAGSGGGKLVAPMPGRITQVLVESGAAVARGAALLVLEAMKMEHTITAPAEGTVETVRFRVGDLVEEGAELVVFVAAE
jgi:3-methylcrotonyl-CoA carboxylase alpha subunit